VFCQWCGKERSDDAVAIHHCGAKDRPPAYCISCGKALSEGEAVCATGGTPAGLAPVVATSTPAPPAAVSDDTAARSDTSPASLTADQVAPAALVPMTRRRQRAVSSDDLRGQFLRKGMFWSSVVGVVACFIDWFYGVPGLSNIEQVPWHWWNPVTGRVFFALLVGSLILSIIAYATSGASVDALVALVGAALCAFAADQVWQLRHIFSDVTGFWLVVAAAPLIFCFSVGSAVHHSRS
jgi:hypothetical protein